MTRIMHTNVVGVVFHNDVRYNFNELTKIQRENVFEAVVGNVTYAIETPIIREAMKALLMIDRKQWGHIYTIRDIADILVEYDPTKFSSSASMAARMVQQIMTTYGFIKEINMLGDGFQIDYCAIADMTGWELIPGDADWWVK